MANRISRTQFLRWTAGLTGSLFLKPFLSPVNLNDMAIVNETLQEKLIVRAIPSSGELLPAIGMGTWLTFDAGSSEPRRQDLKEVLRIFSANGGKLIDSSPMYGSSESVTGDLTKDLGIRKKLFLATKVWTTGEDDGISQMENSFKRMQAGVMDLMQVHNLVDAKIHIRTLKKWKEEGRIRYFGITHYQVSAYPALMDFIRNEKPDFVQFNYNIRVREAEKTLLPFCIDQGVGVINNRPLDGGDLFNSTKGKNIPAWAAEYGIQNWAQFFLKYIISHPGVTCAIPATSKPAHMQENIRAAYGSLPDASARKKMVELFEKL